MTLGLSALRDNLQQLNSVLKIIKPLPMYIQNTYFVSVINVSKKGYYSQTQNK